MEIFDIEEELSKLPHSPGVYIMHDDNEAILYVGKASDLHNRVRQYFRAGHGHNNSPKILRMVSQIKYFEYIITASEMEALVLECNLIKEHRPKYNTMMTDDKGYPYIKITVTENFPRVMMSHQMHRDGNLYFGPYTDGKAVHDTIALIKKLFMVRSCSKKIDTATADERPCLYHQIGQCDAPCSGLISKEQYAQKIEKIVSFLNGNTSEIINELKNDMKKAAEELDFETAAEKRDLIDSINKISEKQRVNKTNGDDKDIIALARNETDIVISIFFVREGTLIGRESHHMNAESSDSDSEVITDFIKQYYVGIPFIPKEILTITPIISDDVIIDYLSERKGQKVSIISPQKGEKKGLIKLAEDNAKLILSQDIERIKRAEKRTIGACMEIAELIGAENVRRLEAYDISNISGYHSVASMVVFIDGKPKRNAYRKFRLRTVEGPDDYASMKEVLSRRFTNDSLGDYPDVIMMDGGKGQINTAQMVLDSLGIDIPVCGMVKDDNHRTRALIYQDKEISFKPGSEAIHMITALQDETHRFAINYHKQLRSNEQTKSILDDIPGIGPKRRKALLLYFKEIDAIRKASIEELMEAEGMNKKSAEEVYKFFN